MNINVTFKLLLLRIRLKYQDRLNHRGEAYFTGNIFPAISIRCALNLAAGDKTYARYFHTNTPLPKLVSPSPVNGIVSQLIVVRLTFPPLLFPNSSRLLCREFPHCWIFSFLSRPCFSLFCFDSFALRTLSC